MRLVSREALVGLIVLLALILSGCQPVQPVVHSSTNGLGEGDNEITTSAAATTTESVTATSTITTSTITTDDAATEVALEHSEAITNTPVIETSPTEVAETVTHDPALIEAGLAVYRAQYCGVCHLLDAAETRGTFGPSHNGMGATAAARITDSTYSGAATTPAEYILESIVSPQLFIVPGYATTSHRMPPYAHLDTATLDALVAFLLAQ